MTTEIQEETRSFQAEVQKVLHLVIHSLYSNKEIFLRELVSNASDAGEKLRFEALQDHALLEQSPDIKIYISINKAAGRITVSDNGIGMSRDEVIENLGKLAHSGTHAFLSQLTGDQAKDSHLIGQFGLGFYSAFLVARKVVVRTRKAGAPPEAGVYWESTGEGEYSIKNVAKKDRGTDVILYLRPDEREFSEHLRLRNIVTKYSDHITFPIYMEKMDDAHAGASDEKDKKVITPTTIEQEVVNQATAIWTLPKSQVAPEDYENFYKHLSHDTEGPLTFSHNRVETKKLQYKTLLYIPKRAPFGMHMEHAKLSGLKLYVQRVFIMDNAECLLPNYLRFIKGVVDSNDLPLNISREILQKNQIVDRIRAGCTKRVLDMLDHLSQKEADKYTLFWQAFGQVLKEGVAEDFNHKEAITRLLRFASTHTNTDAQTVSLKDYVARMQKDQKKIYYLVADTFKTAQNSPHLEIFRKQGIEVLLLFDRIDEWFMGHLTQFEEITLQSVAKGGLDLETSEKDPQKAAQQDSATDTKTELADCIKAMKEILQGRVKEVRETHRLTSSPVCLVSDDNDLGIHLQNVLKNAGQSFPETLPIMEVNPDHPLLAMIKEAMGSPEFSRWVWVLFGQAQLTEGLRLDDPSSFVKDLNALLQK